MPKQGISRSIRKVFAWHLLAHLQVSADEELKWRQRAQNSNLLVLCVLPSSKHRFVLAETDLSRLFVICGHPAMRRVSAHVWKCSIAGSMLVKS